MSRRNEIVAEEITLTLGDRINFPYLLAQQITTFQQAIVKQEGNQSFQEIIEASRGLFELIPDAWRISDKSFMKELNDARINYRVDNRPYWCGVPIGEVQYSIVQRYDPYALFHACINLMQRKGLLAKTLYQEIATGKDFEKSMEELEDKKD